MHRFGPFEVDFATSELRRSGSRVRIQEQPLRILEILLEQPGELVSRERLRERLWPSDTFVDFERSLNAAVAKLRQALHDSADRPVYVETVSRKGYRFIAPVTEATEPEPAPITSRPSRRRAALLAAAALVVCASVILLVWAKFRHRETLNDGGSIRFTVAMPEGTELADASYAANAVISPDGRALALVLSPTGTVARSIWIRPFASEAARRLEGTEGATLPFWSPDSREIGFFAGGQLKSVAAANGSVRVLCDSGELAYGASWGRADVIVYSAGDHLYAVNAGGGPCRQL